MGQWLKPLLLLQRIQDMFTAPTCCLTNICSSIPKGSSVLCLLYFTCTQANTYAYKIKTDMFKLQPIVNVWTDPIQMSNNPITLVIK